MPYFVPASSKPWVMLFMNWSSWNTTPAIVNSLLPVVGAFAAPQAVINIAKTTIRLITAKIRLLYIFLLLEFVQEWVGAIESEAILCGFFNSFSHVDQIDRNKLNRICKCLCEEHQN